MDMIDDALITYVYGLAEARWEHKRSGAGVPYMRHLEQGVKVLDALEATAASEAGFILHGLFQSDDALAQSLKEGLHYDIPARVLVLVMEYRSIANQWLRVANWSSKRPPDIEMKEVKHMLIADKVQNYHNALANYALHGDILDMVNYFRLWLDHLGVGQKLHKKLLKEMTS